MHADGIFQCGHVWAGQFVCRGIFQCGLDSLYVEKYSSVGMHGLHSLYVCRGVFQCAYMHGLDNPVQYKFIVSM